MAFTAGKSKEIEGKSNDWLLDQSLMQSMQDRFCDANNVYMVCLNAQNGVVTKAYGTKEELEYVYSKAGRERHVSLLDKMTGHSIECGGRTFRYRFYQNERCGDPRQRRDDRSLDRDRYHG